MFHHQFLFYIMQKLLEETILFDLSHDQIDLSYGDPWNQIQSQMNRILRKQNSQLQPSCIIRPQLSSRYSKKAPQNPRNSKFSQDNSVSESYPSKLMGFSLIRNQKEQSILQKRNLNCFEQDSNEENKYDKFANQTSLMKLELFLLQKDQKPKSHFKKHNQIQLTIKNKALYENHVHKSDRNEVKKKNDGLKSKLQTQQSSKKDLKYIICNKPSFPSNGKLVGTKTELKTNSNIEDNITSGGGIQVSEKSHRITTKGSFQSLGNELNMEKKVDITIMRRSSIQRKTQQKCGPQKLKAIGVSFKRQIKDSKSPLCILGPAIQSVLCQKNDNSAQKTLKITNIGQLKTLETKILKQNRSLSEIKEQTLSRNQDSRFCNRQLTPFEKDIIQLKKIIKDHQEKKSKLVLQKINLNKDLSLPSLKARSHSFCSEPKKFYRNSKKKFSLLQIQKKIAESKFKIQQSRQQKSKTLSPVRVSEINLILNKKKSQIFATQTEEYKSMIKQRSELIQSQFVQSDIIRKVSLSEILNGKIKIDECFNKAEISQNQNGKSYFFTNYKSLEKGKEENNKDLQERNEDRKKSLNRFKKSKSEFVNSSKNTQNEYMQKILLQRKESKLNTLDSIGKLKNKKNELILMSKNSKMTKVQKENSLEQKSETKWRVNNIEGKDTQQQRKSQFSLRKNLNAQQNISLFKLSLNRNKNKLVIVRK